MPYINKVDDNTYYLEDEADYRPYFDQFDNTLYGSPERYELAKKEHLKRYENYLRRNSYNDSYSEDMELVGHENDAIDRLRAIRQKQHPYKGDGVQWTSYIPRDTYHMFPGKAEYVGSPGLRALGLGTFGGLTGTLVGGLAGCPVIGGTLGTTAGVAKALYDKYRSDQDYSPELRKKIESMPTKGYIRYKPSKSGNPMYDTIDHAWIRKEYIGE